MENMGGLEACTNAELIAIIPRLEERIAGLEKRNTKEPLRNNLDRFCELGR